MTARLSLACSALVLAAALSSPAWAADGDAMSKMSGDMHKDAMKDTKKHKDTMMKTDAMKGGAMKGGAMKKDETPPAQ